MSSKVNSEFETGRKVWSLVVAQLSELTGFAYGVLASIANLLIKNWIVFIVLVSLTGGFIYKRSVSVMPVFRSEMMVNYSYDPRRLFGIQVDTLNQLLLSGRYEDLAAALNIPKDLAEKIVRLDSQNIYRAPLIHDSTPKGLPFYVIIETKERIDLVDVQRGIIDYFNNTPYQKRILSISGGLISEDVSFWERRVAEVDEILAQLKSKGSEINVVDRANVVGPLMRELRLAKKQLDKLKNIANFKLINAEVRLGFSPYIVSGLGSQWRYYLFGLLASILMTALWAEIYPKINFNRL